jgi:predicted regulator of Ras-like GTPase activity (Roadblock/LC7/MglB family)
MRDLDTIARLQDVKGAVLGDLAGAFHDAVHEQDGETIAAVMGFVSSALLHAGDQLGLGALRRISVSGEARACVIVLQGDQVITAWVEPGRSLAAVEKVLDNPVDGKV